MRVSTSDSDRLAHGIEREVVEQNAIHSGIERFTELFQVFDFDFEQHPGVDAPRFLNSRHDGACCSDVVFLYQNRIEQTDSMVHTATASNGIFLRESQSGNGLAGIQNSASGAGDRIYILA